MTVTGVISSVETLSRSEPAVARVKFSPASCASITAGSRDRYSTRPSRRIVSLMGILLALTIRRGPAVPKCSYGKADLSFDEGGARSEDRREMAQHRSPCRPDCIAGALRRRAAKKRNQRRRARTQLIARLEDH